ncbi:cytochrome b5 [Coemansia reversa NRRL 1564]|uniref:Cytochrome b5 n=1 Tax=Coemansia reversa (strain ATCC 12441 / NRRL 1564) TaxID=763665 RepID=A0A2G5BFL2_COERN|nr:cytochrome b5 [Coemansia reversa NRRL 1564]|eukprot:PIA17790.1 cytochrome b5 [Coemansia reversa NRRL 1564]
MSELKQRRNVSRVQSSTPAKQSHQATGDAVLTNRSAWWRIVIRIMLTLVALSICLSFLITETAFWGHKNKWTNWRNYIPRKQRVFTQLELLQYDGTNPEQPILLAIEGDVYDVTLGSGFYGPGSSYHLFAGRDASRAFGTNCLSRNDHLTHDTRGLSEGELAGIRGWHRLFDNHQRYVKVGVVSLDPIDPNSPIPPPCDGAKAKPV